MRATLTRLEDPGRRGATSASIHRGRACGGLGERRSPVFWVSFRLVACATRFACIRLLGILPILVPVKLYNRAHLRYDLLQSRQSVTHTRHTSTPCRNVYARRTTHVNSLSCSLALSSLEQAHGRAHGRLVARWRRAMVRRGTAVGRHEAEVPSREDGRRRQSDRLRLPSTGWRGRPGVAG